MATKEVVRRVGSEIIKESGSDLKEASKLKKLWLGATACTLAFEWGTGNEALIAVIGGNVYRNTHNIALTAAAAGGTSFAEQSLFGLTMAASIYNFPRFMQTVRNKVSVNNSPTMEQASLETDDLSIHEVGHISPEGLGKNEKKWRKLGALATRFFTAFSIGTSLKALKDNGTEEHSFPENVKNIEEDASLIGAGVIGVGAAAAGIATLGRKLGAEQAANVAVDVISSPYLWAGAFLYASRKKIRDWSHKKEQMLAQEDLALEGLTEQPDFPDLS